MLLRQDNDLNLSRTPMRRQQTQPGPASAAPSSETDGLKDSVLTLNQAVVALQGRATALESSAAAQADGHLTLKARKITASAAVVATDYLILVDATAAAVTVTLPAAAPSGRQLCVKKIDASANAVTIARAGTATIDGATSKAVTPQYASLTVMSDGTSWWII